MSEKQNIEGNSLTKQQLLEQLQDIEWDNFEVKTAKTGVPKDVWETVSAFSNTSGGWIVFGVQNTYIRTGSGDQQASEFEINLFTATKHLA